MIISAIQQANLCFEDALERTAAADGRWCQLLGILANAPKEGSSRDFGAYFLCRAPALEAAVLRLHKDADELGVRRDKVPAILGEMVGFGVRQDALGRIRQAETLSEEAHIIGEEDINYLDNAAASVQRYITSAQQTAWQCSFAFIMIRYAMASGFAPDSVSIRLAVAHALDNARAAYGSIAAAAAQLNEPTPSRA